MDRYNLSKFAVLLFVVSFLMAGLLYSAQDNERYTGMCFGVDVTYSGITGDDFDGNTYFENDYELIGIPSINNGLGFRLIIGSDDYRMSMGVAIELTPASGEYGGESVDINFTDIYFFMRYHFLRSDNFSMYIEGNFGMSSMSVEGNAYLYALPDSLYDSTFRGLLFGTGLGINQYLSDSLYLDLSAHVDMKIYPDVEDPIEYSLSLDETATGIVFSGRLGIRFVL